MTNEDSGPSMNAMAAKRAIRGRCTGSWRPADSELARKYNEFIEATYIGQRQLDRKTKELLQIVLETALRAELDQIQAQIRVAFNGGATRRDLLEALGQDNELLVDT